MKTPSIAAIRKDFEEIFEVSQEIFSDTINPTWYQMMIKEITRYLQFNALIERDGLPSLFSASSFFDIRLFLCYHMSTEAAHEKRQTTTNGIESMVWQRPVKHQI